MENDRFVLILKELHIDSRCLLCQFYPSCKVTRKPRKCGKFAMRRLTLDDLAEMFPDPDDRERMTRLWARYWDRQGRIPRPRPRKVSFHPKGNRFWHQTVSLRPVGGHKETRKSGGLVEDNP